MRLLAQEKLFVAKINGNMKKYNKLGENPEDRVGRQMQQEEAEAGKKQQ